MADGMIRGCRMDSPFLGGKRLRYPTCLEAHEGYQGRRKGKVDRCEQLPAVPLTSTISYCEVTTTHQLDRLPAILATREQVGVLDATTMALKSRCQCSSLQRKVEKGCQMVY
jgi:hypothetical protein